MPQAKGAGGLTAVAALTALGLLTACATPTEPDDPSAAVDVPAGWSATQAAGGGAAHLQPTTLVAWWQRFDDPALPALVAEALQANTSVRGAQGALRQAQALRDLSAAALGPTLQGAASAQRGTAGGRSTGNTLQAGLDGAWALDVFGAARAGVDAADADAQASAATLGDVRVQIAAEVALNLILWRTVDVRGAIAQDNLRALADTLQITLWRQQAGLVTVLEAEQARAAADQGRAALPALQVAGAQARHALAVLTGRPPAAALPGPDAPSAAPVPQARDLDGLRIPADTLRQRADVRAAEHRVAAALARVGQAQAQRWPQFALGGSLALNAATVGALGQGSAVLGSLLASVTLPVFDGGALRAQVRAEQAALAQARQAHRAAVLLALLQVEDALVALDGDRQRLASLVSAADAAGRAAGLARQRYASGLTDFPTVLETQRTLYATQDGVANAQADVGRDHVRLFTALGGGWPAGPPQTLP